MPVDSRAAAVLSSWAGQDKPPLPNDALLFDLLATWAPDEATRQRILVENPETLYGST
jgi:hypothetical protein